MVEKRPKNYKLISMIDPPKGVQACELLLWDRNPNIQYLVHDKAWPVFCIKCDLNAVEEWDYTLGGLLDKFAVLGLPRSHESEYFIVTAEYVECDRQSPAGTLPNEIDIKLK